MKLSESLLDYIKGNFGLSDMENNKVMVDTGFHDVKIVKILNL